MVFGEVVVANVYDIKIDNTSTIIGNTKTDAIGGCVLANSHYGLASKVNIYEKGELKIDNKTFDSCIDYDGGDGEFKEKLRHQEL